MTTTYLPVTAPLLTAALHGAAGGLIAAAVLTRARLRDWTVPEPWAITAAWSLLGAAIAPALLLVAVAT